MNEPYEVELAKAKRIKKIIIDSDADEYVKISVVLDKSSTFKVEIRRKG